MIIEVQQEADFGNRVIWSGTEGQAKVQVTTGWATS
jgi:hypothetical protein